MRAHCWEFVYTLYICVLLSNALQRKNAVRAWICCDNVPFRFLQDDVLLTVHYVGAMMVFGFGNVYMWFQTLITLALNRSTDGQQSSCLMVLVRLVLSALATAFFITSKRHSWEGLYCKPGTFHSEEIVLYIFVVFKFHRFQFSHLR